MAYRRSFKRRSFKRRSFKRRGSGARRQRIGWRM